MPSKDHKASIKNVRKWEKEFKISLDYDIAGSSIIRMRCVVCKSWEQY